LATACLLPELETAVMEWLKDEGAEVASQGCTAPASEAVFGDVRGPALVGTAAKRRNHG
jgi:hypothetical protein